MENTLFKKTGIFVGSNMAGYCPDTSLPALLLLPAVLQGTGHMCYWLPRSFSSRQYHTFQILLKKKKKSFS